MFSQKMMTFVKCCYISCAFLSLSGLNYLFDRASKIKFLFKKHIYNIHRKPTQTYINTGTKQMMLPVVDYVLCFVTRFWYSFDILLIELP